MSDPILVQNTFCWFVCDRDPTVSEPVIDAIGFYIDPNWLVLWWNQTTNDVFLCFNLTPGSMVWEKMIMAHNLPPAPVVSDSVDSKAHPHYEQISLPFNTVRTPNAHHDVFVIANVQMYTAVLQNCEIHACVHTGREFASVASVSLSKVIATLGKSLSFIVPKNTQYQLTNNGNGNSTIISVYELMLRKKESTGNYSCVDF